MNISRKHKRLHSLFTYTGFLLIPGTILLLFLMLSLSDSYPIIFKLGPLIALLTILVIHFYMNEVYKGKNHLSYGRFWDKKKTVSLDQVKRKYSIIIYYSCIELKDGTQIFYYQRLSTIIKNVFSEPDQEF